MDTMQTPKSDILESLRAIQTAATERHAALLAEAKELEAAFPTLQPKTDEQRAKRSAYMKVYNAKRRAALAAQAASNGTVAVQ